MVVFNSHDLALVSRLHQRTRFVTPLQLTPPLQFQEQACIHHALYLPSQSDPRHCWTASFTFAFSITRSQKKRRKKSTSATIMRAQISVTLALLHLQNCAAAPLLSSAVESGTSGDVLHPLNLTDPSTIPRIGTPVIGVPQRIGIPDFDLPTSECVTCEGSQTIGETVSVEPDKTTTDVESNAVSNTRRSALAIDPDALICGRSYDSKGNLVVKRCGVEEPYLPKEVLDLPSLEVPTPSTISPDTLATSNGLDRRAISFGNKRSPLVECSLNAGGKEECKYYDGMMHPVQTTTASASPEFSSVFGKRVETTKEADETKKKRFVLGDCPIIAKRSDGSYFRDCGYSSPEGPLDHLNITSILGHGPVVSKTDKRNCLNDILTDGSVVRRCAGHEPIPIEGGRPFPSQPDIPSRSRP